MGLRELGSFEEDIRMRVTVLCPTMRVGGLDVLFDSLARQTCMDFELVLVDGVHAWRKSLVKKRAKKYPFPVTHVPPRDNPFPRNCYCRYVNTGIAHARGELVLFLCDYSWLSTDTVERHARYHEGNKNGLLMLDYSYTELPPVRNAFPGYGPKVSHAENPVEHERIINEAGHTYLGDLQAGRLNSVMWSLFKRPIDFDGILELPQTLRHHKSPGPQDRSWCTLKNESIPTEALLDINGLDETFDDSHLYQDTEVSYRLTDRGMTWHSVLGGEVLVVNPRPIFNAKLVERPMSTNHALLSTRDAVNVNLGFNLRDWRKQACG